MTEKAAPPTFAQSQQPPYAPQQSYQHPPPHGQPQWQAHQQGQQQQQHQQAAYDPVRAGMEFQASLMAQCANGNHQFKTDYGVVGIILAVVCFPCGLIALCVDKKDVCTRCGKRV